MPVRGRFPGPREKRYDVDGQREHNGGVLLGRYCVQCLREQCKLSIQKEKGKKQNFCLLVYKTITVNYRCLLIENKQKKKCFKVVFVRANGPFSPSNGYRAVE